MVERRPTLGILAHVVLILGVLAVAFPVYITFVASTHTADEIVQVPMPMLPGAHATVRGRYGVLRYRPPSRRRSPKMNARELAANVTELTTLPDVYQQIRALADDPHASLKQFADVVSMDAAISARLLRLVNSPFYGLPGKVDSVLRAINLIGTDELCNLVLASSIGGRFGFFSAYHSR